MPLPMPSALDFAVLGMGSMASLRGATPSPPPPSVDPSPSSFMSSAALMDRLAGGYGPYPPGAAMANAGGGGASAGASHLQHPGSGAQASALAGGGYGKGMGPLWGGTGMGLPGDMPSFPTPPHGPAALALLGAGASGGGAFSPLASMPGAAGSGVRPRARKADWVIVTEDTAIKNAAGAVAKVCSLLR